MLSSQRGSRRLTLTVAGMWVVLGAVVGSLVFTDLELGRIGRGDLRTLHGTTWIVLAAIASSALVGSALVVRRPRHPVGWLFTGLAYSMALSGAIDLYATWGALARPGSLPGARQAAVLGDGSFIPWLVLVALVLHLTPNGHPLDTRWGRVAQGTVAFGLIAFVSGLVARRTLAAPFSTIRNPMTIPALAPAAGWVGAISIIGVGLGLVAAAASLVVRYRRARGMERAQLRWLVIAVIPMPLFVLAAFVASTSKHDAATVIATGGFIVLVPAAAGLSVGKYHLYDTERILNRTLTYVLLSLALIGAYIAVVLIATRGLGSHSGSSEVSATLAAVTAAALAAPLRNRLQDTVDRRFNRRRHEAIRRIRAANLTGWADTDIDLLLRQALEDPSILTRYWLADRQQWVSADGQPSEPTDADVEIRRDHRVIARLAYDETVLDRETVALAAAEALVALDNIGLRAELGAQLHDLSESRARIVRAQQDERHRIERDLHDGAQQRLLALALQLQAAQVNGGAGRLRQAVSEAIQQAQQAVQELRELANGLHPASLTDGGLNAAFEEMARRSPIPVHIHGQVKRLHPTVETTAWFVTCEAISNIHKHAKAANININVRGEDEVLLIQISDDGQGGALAEGAGLRGIRDRAEAIGGRLTVQSQFANGTDVTVALPCAS